MSSLWYPSPKESPILGLTGMWGGISSGLIGGGAAETFVQGTTYNFTNYSHFGPYGPTKTQADTYWATQQESTGLQENMTITSGIHFIPFAAGTYSVEVRGAMGGPRGQWATTQNFPDYGLDADFAMQRSDQDYGGGSIMGGRGALFQATMTVGAETTMAMVVGLRGCGVTDGPFGASGGGASYIAIGDETAAQQSSLTPIIVAGGGGGTGGSWDANGYGSYPTVYHATDGVQNTGNGPWTAIGNPSVQLTDVWGNPGANNYGFVGGSWQTTRWDSTHGANGRKLNDDEPLGGWLLCYNQWNGPAGGTGADNNNTKYGQRGTANQTPTTESGVNQVRFLNTQSNQQIFCQGFGGFGGGGMGWGNFGSGGGGGGYVGGDGWYSSRVGSIPRAGGGGGSSYSSSSGQITLSSVQSSGGSQTSDSDTIQTLSGFGNIKITKTA